MPTQAYGKPFQPVQLKALVTECDISQSSLALAVAGELGRNVSRATMNLVINRGYEPVNLSGVRRAIEEIINRNPRAMAWLAGRGMEPGDIWRPLGRDMRLAMPKGFSRVAGQEKRPAVDPENPEQLEPYMEVEMLTQEAMKHFKVFRNPFLNDIQKATDIYMGEEHIYIEAAMLDAARNGGFLAVIGESGCGKSTIRKKVTEQLLRDGSTGIIFPYNHKLHVPEKTYSRITAVSLCDAMILDISDEKPKLKTEFKLRQLHRLLVSRSNQGQSHVLIIEEAHNLTRVTLKYLKQFNEMDDGYKKLLGIIMIGQPELKDYLDERRNPDLREVIRRVQVAEIRGLNGDIRNYLAFKFKRVGKDLEDVFNDDSFGAISKRLAIASGNGGAISHAYPSIVNIMAIRAMNMAQEMGEPKISADVIMAL